jgi:Fanconi anemia group M protein
MKITVFTTNSAQDTAEFIIGLTKKVQQNKDTKEKIFKKKTSSIQEAQEQIISGIPGVNIYRAQNLLTYFSTIKNIFNADETELKNVEGIGPGTAKKIKDIAEHNYNDKQE